jgi:hypothetical protein
MAMAGLSKRVPLKLHSILSRQSLIMYTMSLQCSLLFLSVSNTSVILYSVHLLKLHLISWQEPSSNMVRHLAKGFMVSELLVVLTGGRANDVVPLVEEFNFSLLFSVFTFI